MVEKIKLWKTLELIKIWVWVEAAYHPHGKNAGVQITQIINKRKTLKGILPKFIDDLSFAEAVSFIESLMQTKTLIPKDLSLSMSAQTTNCRQGPTSCKNNLIICKLIVRKIRWRWIEMNAKELFASIPQLTLLGKGREYLDVVEYTKLLGVKLRSFFIIIYILRFHHNNYTSN